MDIGFFKSFICVCLNDFSFVVDTMKYIFPLMLNQQYIPERKFSYNKISFLYCWIQFEIALNAFIKIMLYNFILF